MRHTGQRAGHFSYPLLAAHDVNVLVGDFNMEADLVTEAVQIFPLGADVTVHVWCPSGIRGDKLGRAGAPRLTGNHPREVTE